MGGFAGGFRPGGLDTGGFGAVRDRGFQQGGWERDRGDWGGYRSEGFQPHRYGYDAGFRPEPDRSSRTLEARPFDERGRGLESLPARDYASPSRTRLDGFLGLPTDAGLGHVSGFEGTRVTAGRVEGPRGGSASVVSATRVRYIPPEVRSSQAWTVRNSFARYNLFTPAWYRDHPGVWTAAGLAASAWAPATWFGVADWLGCDAIPEDYDYGSTVLYQGGNVYVEGQPVGSDAQYYEQAGAIAASGSKTPDDQSQWMSFGVFGMVQGDQTDPTMIFQLAVDPQGNIRGNCFNTLTDASLPVNGAVDKKTQRVAWTVGDNKKTVFDTGLYNLTKDQAPLLVHFGKDRTQDWLMVRLQSKAAGDNGS